MAHTTNPTRLDERLVHMAMEHLLPSTIQYHDDTQEWETTTWSESCDALGEWEDREGCSTDYLAEHDAFNGMASRDLAPVTAAAMRLIREMGRDRAAEIIAGWPS